MEMPSSKPMRLCPDFFKSTKRKHQSFCVKKLAVREDSLETSCLKTYSIELRTKSSKRSSPKATQPSRRANRKIYKKFNASCSSQHINSTQLESAKNSCYIKAIPDELLLSIFSYVNEIDLCHLAQVCTHFATVCQDGTLWKKLYEKVFEMKRVLMHTPRGFYDHVEVTNEQSWKESFKSFYAARHVHPKIAKESRVNCADTNARNICYYERIQDAVQASSPGEIIIVHRGVYDEQLYIDKPLTIIGTADEENCHAVIQSSQLTVVRFGPGSSDAFLGHFNIRHCPNSPSQFSKEGCLEILGGCSPTIYNCHMNSLSNAGATLYVHDKGTRPRVSKCCIRDSENVGLFVTDEAQGIYEDCEITNTKLAGVWVKSRANPVIRRSTVHHGRDVGFFIFDCGLGYYDGIDVHSNRIAGFEIRSGANPVVVRCSIHHGLTGGVYCHDDARGEFLENKIYSNTYAGVWITSQSNPTIKNNEIFDGQQGGVYIFGEGRGLIEGNDIHDNALAGIQIRAKSNPIVRCNKIYGGQHGGIYVHEGGLGLIEKNEIYGNTLAGIWITTGSAPNLRMNRIHSGRQVGVYFYDGGCGTLEENEIFHHKYSGIQIRSGSNPIIRKNKIWGGQSGGVLIYNEGLGILEDNEIFDNATAGVWIKTDSNPVLKRNRIHDGLEGGVCIFNGGKGVLEDNDIFRNTLTGVLISTFSFPVMKNNRIFDGGAAGVEITNNAGGVLEGNEIFNNRFDGICLATGVKPQLKDNRLHGNKGLVERAVEAGQCLYQVSGNSCYPMHDFYRCATCNTSDGYAICVSCINTCHVGHDVEFIRHDRFFCDCGAGTTGVHCRLNPVNEKPSVVCASNQEGEHSSSSDHQEHTQEIES